jgi:penicillin amidase
MKPRLSTSSWLTGILMALVLAPAVGARARHERAPQPSAAKGSDAAISIVRDGNGVPHIRASGELGAVYGLGYAHAQDRLWQMEYQRRLGSGRLAEILGPAFLPSDRFFRTVGTHRAAASAWTGLPPDGRAALEAYAAGVNAYIGTLRRSHLPIEFRIYGIDPAPWRPVDTLVWMKTLAWGVGRNWDNELMRARLSQRLGVERTAELMPLFMAGDPLILPDEERFSARPAPGVDRSAVVSAAATPEISAAQADALMALHRALRQQLGFGGEHVGSNSWVLAGSRTTTGKPMLANDPHLDSQVPSNWYLAHITGGKLDVIGATFPGIPCVVAGHNGQLSWGITNTGADVEDLFVEQIAGGEVMTPHGPEPVDVVPEIIKVKGQADVVVSVRITPHGPIISDVVAPTGPPLALRWAGLDDRDDTVAGLLRLNLARNGDELRAALRLVHVPMQNFVYADRDGNIGYMAPGALPIRRKGDGLSPVAGWTGEFDWTGYVPFEELPAALNPERGFIVTANNRISPSYPYYVGNFAPYYRAGRIVELIAEKRRHSLRDMARMQADVTSLHAREVLPRLLNATPADDRSSVALAMLQGWDGTIRGDSPQAAIFEAWLARVPAALFADDLGDVWGSYSGTRYLPDIAAAHAVNDPTSRWCDDVGTPEPETCEARLGLALAEGLASMAKAQGTDDLGRWRWDRAHRAVFPHRALEGHTMAPLFERSTPTGGDQFTINIGAPVAGGYEQRHVNDYRQVVDLGVISRSRFIVAPGQSGSPFDRHYDDLLGRWRQVEYVPMRFEPLAISASDTVVLWPERQTRPTWP